MALEITNPLEFSVRRSEPELIAPEKPTPHVLEPLSDIDDQLGFRFQFPGLMFYKNNNPLSKEKGEDPVKVIREALAKALVFYYPFAGRLVQGPNRKLLVDCTGEGVLFIEADADVRLQDLGETIRPRCPYLDELLYDVPGSAGILGCPLLLIQVTRFACGGFSFGVRLNHTMSDAFGLMQLLNTVGEFARGADTPSTTPIWQREILSARNHDPQITRKHAEYEEDVGEIKPTCMDVSKEDNMIHQSFFFGHKEISSLRSRLSLPLRKSCTTYELLTACFWRCRTAAFRPNSDETVRISSVVTARGKRVLDVPPGYYGNAFALMAAVSKAGDLCKRPLSYAVELVKKSKARMSREHMRSLTDFLVVNGRRHYITAGNHMVSDTTNVGFEAVDFGWGKAVCGGIATGIPMISCYSRFKDGILLPICLPPRVMKRFHLELHKMITSLQEDDDHTWLTSAL